MSLGSRLDRLRGQRGDRSASAAVDVGVGLKQPDRGARSAERLAEALNGVADPQGFVIVEHRVPLPGGERCNAPLTFLPETRHLDRAEWVYLDTETTGLSGGVGNVVFMIGIARLAEDFTLAVRQYLLPNFAAEAGMLQGVLEWLGDRPVLVSYNGKSFDLPVLLARLRLQHTAHTLADLAHLDLMHMVRSAYGQHWPDCRLQTAERRRLGLVRKGDLPGAAAPAAWRSWLHDGEVDALRGVLAHNAQDTVSLALLHRAMVKDYHLSDRPDLDHATIGRAWMRAGWPDEAERVWKQAGPRLSPRGQMDLARLYRRQSRWQDVETVYSP